MTQRFGYSSLILASMAALAVVQPAQASSTQVVNVRTTQSGDGLEVVLETKGGDRLEVFSVNRNNAWIADVTNAKLSVPQGEFQQSNPAPGIASIQVMPIDGQSFRVIVTGNGNTPPTGTLAEQSGKGLILRVQPTAPVTTVATVQIPVPPAPTVTPSVTPPAPPAAVLPPLPTTITTVPPVATAPTTTPMARPTAATTVTAPPTQPTVAPTFTTPTVTPSVPEPTLQAQANPSVRIAQSQPSGTTPTRQGDPATLNPNPTPPTLPRAVPPPLGDITISNLDPTPAMVDLGSRERIPRLVLRNAPAREVLSLLARAAGANLAYVDSVATTTAGAAPNPAVAGTDPAAAGTDMAGGPRVTLDIENEPVQDVFNHVLRLSGLQANKIGGVVYVGPNLPLAARNLISRTVRLNQANATSASSFLATLGAATTVSVPGQPEIVTQTIAGVQGAPPVTQQITRQSTPTIQSITNTAAQGTAGTDPLPLVLSGLQVTPDERLNAVTLVGEPSRVELATSYLKQLDLRRRQVAVNVKIIDVDLTSSPFSNASFSFGVDDTFVSADSGVLGINFGRRAPNAQQQPPILTTGSSPVSGFFPGVNIPTASGFTGFLARLTQSIVSNNAKVLTDPTLIIQEGQTSSINLVDQIVTDSTQTITQSQTSTLITTTNTLKDVGLQLSIQVERIDDNGFVTMNISPRVSSPSGQQVTATGTFPIIGTREVSSGNIRVRDNQTIILAGIIREQDRQAVRKVPILGDLPIIGALFRSVDSDSNRNEVIVVVTTNILDDSNVNSAVNYGYTPSRESQEVLQRGGYR